MALPRGVYRELEDILRPENISENPAVLDGYVRAFDVVCSHQPGFPEKVTPYTFTPRPEAVVLPGSTEEVQAILKLCNRRGIKCKAFGTGYGTWALAGSEGVIILDLRRMNRILEIDEKNMYIVVEPYVSFAQVQAEAMKRGLNCHVISAGAQTSFLASHTSVGGGAFQSHGLGYSGRKLLGVEWVLPTGEVLRVGSIGSGAGWFSGDGPGPSLRGIIRGICGAFGGLGVFTKCACHLNPWPGPSVMEVKGVSPEYETEVPPHFEYHLFHFPGYQNIADAMYKIAESEIAYVLQKTGGATWQGAFTTTSNNEYWEEWQKGELQTLDSCLCVLLAANSTREHEYQVKVLERIIDETEGEVIPLGEKPTFKNRDFLQTIKVCHIPRQAFRLTGSFTDTFTFGVETMDSCLPGVTTEADLKKPYIESGALLDNGGADDIHRLPYEGGHYGACEGLAAFDPTDEESIKGVMHLGRVGLERAIQTPLSIGFFAHMPRLSKLGVAMSNYHLWLRKVKKAFDPDAVSDSSFYISAEEE